jgi:hypothetical protein
MEDVNERPQRRQSGVYTWHRQDAKTGFRKDWLVPNFDDQEQT